MCVCVCVCACLFFKDNKGTNSYICLVLHAKQNCSHSCDLADRKHYPIKLSKQSSDKEHLKINKNIKCNINIGMYTEKKFVSHQLTESNFCKRRNQILSGRTALKHCRVEKTTRLPSTASLQMYKNAPIYIDNFKFKLMT